MAKTQDEILQELKKQAASVGVDPNTVSADYAKGLSAGNDIYVDGSAPRKRNDISSEMDKLANMQKQQAIAGLERSRDNALSNLDSEQATIKPMYYEKRNQANVQNKIGAKNFAEFMANRGTRNSGENDQARLMQNMSLQNSLTDLNTQEQSALNDISRRRTGINNAYESDLAGVNAGIEAQALQNQIAQMQRQQDIAREDSRYNREFDYRLGRDEVADQRYLDEIEWQRSEDNPAYKSQLLNNQIADLELANLPEMQRLQLQQLRKQIANIGNSPSRTSQQIEMDNIRLEQAKEQLKMMQAERAIMQNENVPPYQQTITGTYPYGMMPSPVTNPMISQPKATKTEEDEKSNSIEDKYFKY